MRKVFLIFGFLLVNSLLMAQKVEYYLSMPKPQNHYFEVEMRVSDWNSATLELSMPVWAPGSYLVRDFPKNVNQVLVKDNKKRPIRVSKKTKNTWLVDSISVKEFSITYQVYAFELSVRTSFLDATHGFVSGSSVFMFVKGLENSASTLYIKPHSSFKKISTSLPFKEKIKEYNVYSFQNFDELVDCPIEIGNHLEFEFIAAGIPHTVAMYGEGNYKIEPLKNDMAKIVQSCTDVFGFNPNKKYTFIIHNLTKGQGGLEHTNSTVLSVNRWSYEENYLGFLNLVAHEYFHLWNVKRIRPIELGPFDYSQENYTSLLWVMEGFTSYYDELLLKRSGYYTDIELLQKLNSMCNYVEGSVGARVQPVSHASFDAWIKAYKPNENSSNTTMSYYSRGALIACLLDVLIIEKSKGNHGLDHFMQYLYMKYFVELKRGFSESEFKQDLKRFVEYDVEGFFTKYINGTEILPFAEILSKVGVQVTSQNIESFECGISFSEEGGRVQVNRIASNSSAEDSGISVGDEIIAVNGFRVNAQEFKNQLSKLTPDQSLSVLLSRDSKLMSLPLSGKLMQKPQFIFSKKQDEKQNTLFNYWMR